MGRWPFLLRFLSPLYLGLLRDGRVPTWTKLVLAGAAVYLLLPVDLVPDWVPVAGWVDDLMVAVAALAWVYGRNRQGGGDPRNRS